MSRPTVTEITPQPEALDRDTFGGLVTLAPQTAQPGGDADGDQRTKRIVSG